MNTKLMKDLTLLEIIKSEKDFLTSNECKKSNIFDYEKIKAMKKAYNEILKQIPNFTDRQFIEKYASHIEQFNKYCDRSYRYSLKPKQEQNFAYFEVFSNVVLKFNSKYIYTDSFEDVTYKKMSEITLLDMINFADGKYTSKKAQAEILADIETLTVDEFLNKYINILLSLEKEDDKFKEEDFVKNKEAINFENYNNEIVRFLAKIHFKYEYSDIIH